MNPVFSYLHAVAMDERRQVNLLVTSDIHTSGIKSIDASGASVIIIAGDIMGAANTRKRIDVMGRLPDRTLVGWRARSFRDQY